MKIRGRRSAGAASLLALLLAGSSLTGCSGSGETDDPTESSGSETRAGPVPCCEGLAQERAVDLFGTFERVEASGTSDTVVDLPAEVTAATMGVVRFSYAGDSPAIVWSLDEHGEERMILIDSAMELASADPGTFAGDSSWWAANEPPASLRVDASGSWELTVLPVDALEPLPDSGHGARAYLYDGPGGPFTGTKPDTGVGMSITEVSMRFQGGGVEELVSEQRTDPEFFGRLPAGPAVLLVNHRAEWTLDLAEDEG